MNRSLTTLMMAGLLAAGIAAAADVPIILKSG